MRLSRFWPVALFFLLGCDSLWSQSYFEQEAESALLFGNANVANCGQASGQAMVRDLTGGPANALVFTGLTVPQAGGYSLHFAYYAKHARPFSYQINQRNPVTDSLPPSGDWCFEGGFPGDYAFNDSLRPGDTLRFFDAPIIDRFWVESLSPNDSRGPATFYLSQAGDDSQDGQSPATAWQSLSRLNQEPLQPGDSLLFRAGDTLRGELLIDNVVGSPALPLFLGHYGTGPRPVLDGDGFLATLHVRNSSYLHLEGLEITNNGGPAQPGHPQNQRYGIFLENTFNDGTVFTGYIFRNLSFRNIFPTLSLSDDDMAGIDGNAFFSSNSAGSTFPIRFDSLLIEDCYLTRTARHAIKLRSVANLTIRHNLLEQIGGAGILVGGNCRHVLVEGNTTDHTGSSIDPRMAGRGSGLWTFSATDVVVQHNRFMHARGIKDSYGMHIDFGNRDVVYQYNYSEDNEGGFVEILGDNINVGYRYNVSVGDGWRSRGNQDGRSFWLSDFAGNGGGIGSDSIFVYNNTVIVDPAHRPDILIVAQTGKTRFYNNLVYAPAGFGQVDIRNATANNDFDHNLWFGPIPGLDLQGQPYRGPGALTSDPLLAGPPFKDSNGCRLQAGSPALGAGRLVYEALQSGPRDYFFSHAGQDYFGNVVPFDQAPNIGAYQGPGLISSRQQPAGSRLLPIPNPAPRGAAVRLTDSGGTFSGPVQVRLTNLKGQACFQVWSGSLADLRLPTSDLAPGVYLLTVSSGQDLSHQKLVVY